MKNSQQIFLDVNLSIGQKSDNKARKKEIPVVCSNANFYDFFKCLILLV